MAEPQYHLVANEAQAIVWIAGILAHNGLTPTGMLKTHCRARGLRFSETMFAHQMSAPRRFAHRRFPDRQ